MGWPDLLSKRWGDEGDDDEHDELGGDNLCDSTNLTRSIPDANASALDPCRYSQLHTLAHVAADHEAVINCNLLIPNGTADHTKLVVAITL